MQNAQTRVLAFCNQKGGVGKSTTTFHLARAAALQGLRVLIVDADPQGNISAAAAAEVVKEDQAGLADVLSAHAPDVVADVIVPSIWKGVDIVPTSGETLGSVRDELVIAGAGRELRLREALNDVVGQYDLILIDCAPSLDQLTINALAAASAVVIITHSKQWSLNGLAQLLNTIWAVRSYYNSELSVAGIIVNQHESGTVSGSTWLGELNQAAQQRETPVLDPPIPKRVVIADSTEAAHGLDEWGSADAREIGQIYDGLLRQLVEQETS